MVSSHECDYCICNDCYETKRQKEKKNKESKTARSTRLSRSKRKRNDMYDDDDDDENRSDNYSIKSKGMGRKCMKGDHEVTKLKVCCDAAYFTNDYVKKKLIDETGTYPKSCKECGKSFID